MKAPECKIGHSSKHGCIYGRTRILLSLVPFLFMFVFLTGNISQAWGQSSGIDYLKSEIEFAKQKLNGFQSDLTSELNKLTSNPARYNPSKIASIQQKVRSRRDFLRKTLIPQYEDLKKDQAWWQKFRSNAETVGSALLLLSGKYDEAGKVLKGLPGLIETMRSGPGAFIFGTSDEEIYGANWQQAEEYNKELYARARSIRAEKNAIDSAVKALGNLQNPASQATLQNLKSRLSKLKKEARQVKDGILAVLRIYVAEKENIGQYAIFWGEYSGQYIEAVLANMNIPKLAYQLIDLAMDPASLTSGSGMAATLLNYASPLFKTYFANNLLTNMSGGSCLFPELQAIIIKTHVMPSIHWTDLKSNLGKESADWATNTAYAQLVETQINGMARASISAGMEATKQGIEAAVKSKLSSISGSSAYKAQLRILYKKQYEKAAEEAAKKGAEGILEKAKKIIDKVKLIKSLCVLVPT